MTPSARSSVTTDVAEALARGRQHFLATQKPDGHWVGELEGDTILESEYVLLLAFLRKPIDPRLGNYLRQQMLPDGGWANYPGGPADLSVSVKGYFALKLMGDAVDEPHMVKTAEVVRTLGGAEASNSFTRFYLALLGQTSYANCPTVPVEMMLLPRWFPFNIYAMSAWSRTIVVPLAVVNAFRPVTNVPDELGIRELFLQDPAAKWSPSVQPRMLSWANFFLKVDGLLKWKERLGLHPLRKSALKKAVHWMRERFQGSDGLGAIFPPMIYTCVVLKCLGVSESDPEFRWALQQLKDLMIAEDDTLRLQPCVSPVWDTALTLIGLADAGEDVESDEVMNAVEWLLAKEVRTPGDWARSVRHVEPAGWFFEYANAHYPDTDDTSMVLIALARLGRRSHPAAQRAVAWLLAMQNDDGGWAAFDRNIDNEVLTKVPFADHNAMLDPSCPDITARILESLSHYGYKVGHLAVDKAVAFILAQQDATGAWWGRWGINYIYGTWQVLVGLAAAGYAMNSPCIRNAVRWLKDVQNNDGGWGETAASYDDKSLAGVGPSTASQTAWALLGLLAADNRGESVESGVQYLLETQADDGRWYEDAFTGTGFPKVFYLKYHLYPAYFPLMALGRYFAGRAMPGTAAEFHMTH